MQPELLAEVVQLLQNSALADGGRNSSNSMQIDQIVTVMRNWGQMNGIMV